MKRVISYAVIAAMMLPYMPSAAGAMAPPPIPRASYADQFAPKLGDTQAIGAHYAKRWEDLSNLSRQAQGQGSLNKEGAKAFLREKVDVVGITSKVLATRKDLDGMASELELQFSRDELFLRSHQMPAELLERLSKAREDYQLRRRNLDDALDRLAYGQKIANYDAQKDALGQVAKLVAAMPSAKSFVPMSVDALKREGKIGSVRPVATNSAALRTAIEGATEKSVQTKSAPAAPTAADLAATDDVQLSTKIKAQASSLGNNPVAIFNWVRNNTDFIPTYGSIQGSELTRINKRGNAVDTASLLIAMLRAANIPAHYVYGTVRMPIDQAQNWLGGGIAASQVVELMQKGGIPAQSVTTGGQVSAVQFEHTWVEAYVDFTPSRGAVNRAAKTWVPMDASFKVYDIHPPINLTQGAPFDATALLNQVNANVVHGQFGSVTGFNLTTTGAALDTYRPGAIDYANSIAPDVRLIDVRGFAAVVPATPEVLAGTLPFALVARGNTYSALPATLQHQLKLSYYASDADYAAGTVSYTFTTPLSKVGISTIGVEYVPATAADTALFAQLRQSNAATLSPYLINVVPQVQIEGAAVPGAAIPAVAMGTSQYWKADISDPQGIYPPTSAANKILAGSHTAFVVDAAGVTTDMVQKRLDLIPQGVSYPLREGLQQAGMHFWMLRDSEDQNWASQFTGKVVRLPSLGGFSAPLQATFAFGVARSGFFQGFQTDVKRNLYAAVNDTQAHQVQMFTLMGNTGSMLESMVWEALFGVQLGSGTSAARVLSVANDQKIPVYMVDSTNVNNVLPLLQISADAKEEISNAIAAGNRVVVPEREVTIGLWTGAGYVIQDPTVGTGVYQIDGGLSGGALLGCIIKALLESCDFQKLLANRLNQFLQSLKDKAFDKVGAALLAPAGAEFAAAVALSAQFQWFLAFQFTIIDMTELIATGEAEELAASLLLCSLPSRCGFGRGAGMAGNPVFTGTGEKMQVDTDYVGAGDDPLMLTRTYLSYAHSTDGQIGQKWRHTYERSIFIPPPTTGVDETGTPIGGGYSITEDTGSPAPAQLPPVSPVPQGAVVLRGDGGYMQFNYTGSGYSPDADVPEFLTRQSDPAGNTTGWVYQNEHDETEIYDANGFLLSITNRKGMTQTLSYDSSGFLSQVRDQFGRTLTFTYNASGLVDTVTDPAGGIFHYGYDDSGNLTSVQSPDLKTRSYFYEQDPAHGFLTGITDENGSRYATYAYDFQGRVADEIHAGGVDHRTFTYDDDLTTHTVDALGTTNTYTFVKIFEDKRLVQMTQPCSSGCASGSVSQLAYDGNGFIASETDFDGNQTAYARNARNLVTSQTDAAGSSVARTTTTEYDPQWRVATKIIEPTSAGSRVTVNTLDARGNVLTKTVTVGTDSRTWTYTYNALGQMLTMDGPRTDVTDVTTWTYVNGNMDTMTDAAGNVTHYANYDAHGRPGTITDANGLVTTLVYDPRGRLQTSNAAGETTRYDYDGVGNLSKLTLPDGTFLSYGYDGAERLTSITDSLGNSVTYTLDNAGNRIQEATKDPSSALAQTLARVFDGLSRVKELHGALDQITGYTYDNQGNLKSATDPLTHVTANNYDALNRLTQVTEPQLAGAPAAGTIAYAYDPQDNLSSVTDQRGLVTNYGYSGFDELKTLSSPDTGVTQYTYDPAGNVKTMQDARGASASYSYDALNRLKTLLYSDESLAFTYDDTATSPNSKGRLSKVTDGSGSTTYGYDLQGRVTSKLQLAGSVSSLVTYSYNAQGQLTTLVTPSGQTVGYGYTNNQVTSVTVNGINVLTGAKYFPFGDVASWTWGNGQAYQRIYDSDGRIQSVTIAGTTRTYGFDTASRITGLTDAGAAPATATIGYDNLDRLTSAINGTAYNELFVYDLIGNRTSETIGGTTTTLTYGATSNRLTQIGAQAIGYDNAGNTQSDGTFTYGYSQRNRLVQVSQGSSTVATYKHNAFGERVTKTLGGATITFVFDEDGHLLGEYGASGGLIQETVWLEDTPIATLRPKTGGVDIDYVWADHLDTPRAVTTSDAANTLLWQWDSEPFGATQPQVQSITYNLRFPGQYFDVETAKHYNYYRDYDPRNGRYEQSDPIGLDGGANTYSYVAGNSLLYFDRTGEAKRPDRWGGGRGADGGRSYPGGGGIYELRCGGTLMYVGQTSNYRSRYHGHNGPGGKLDQCGCGEAKMVPTIPVSDPNERQALERLLIKEHTKRDPKSLPLNLIRYKR